LSLFDIARLAGRDTILKTGFASTGLWNYVIDGESHFFGATISAFKPISVLAESFNTSTLPFACRQIARFQ
jgi:hypothetical protein